MPCQNHPFFYLSGCKQESVNAHPLTKGAPATAGGGNLLRFTIPYHLELTHKTPINPHLNRRTFQSPGDAVPRHCQQTAHLVPLKLFEMQIRPRNAPLVHFIYIFAVCGHFTLLQTRQFRAVPTLESLSVHSHDLLKPFCRFSP